MIRVLLLDDNVMLRQAFVRLLEAQPDIEVVAQAGSLAEAREMLSGIEVAIIDRGLPDGDGLELIAEVRQASPGAAVLVMSATLEERHPQEALKAGADGILDKMASPDEIYDHIISALRNG